MTDIHRHTHSAGWAWYVLVVAASPGAHPFTAHYKLVTTYVDEDNVFCLQNALYRTVDIHHGWRLWAWNCFLLLPNYENICCCSGHRPCHSILQWHISHNVRFLVKTPQPSINSELVNMYPICITSLVVAVVAVVVMLVGVLLMTLELAIRRERSCGERRARS